MNIESEINDLKKRVEYLEMMLNTKKTNTANRDKTHYVFENKIYPKNRLVLAIISKYVKDNNPTFEELQSVFDKSLQGSLNVVESYQNALKIKDATKRYFMKNPLITKDNQIIVVCTQWGIFNIIKFEKVATNLGYNIDKINSNN